MSNCFDSSIKKKIQNHSKSFKNSKFKSIHHHSSHESEKSEVSDVVYLLKLLSYHPNVCDDGGGGRLMCCVLATFFDTCYQRASSFIYLFCLANCSKHCVTPNKLCFTILNAFQTQTCQTAFSILQIANINNILRTNENGQREN